MKSASLQLPRLAIVQGDGEKRTEVYLEYSEGVSEPSTQYNPKNACGVFCSAQKQASVAREL